METSDTIAYVVNLNNDDGFLIISSDRRYDGVLAYVEQGNYNEADVVGNDGFGFYLGAMKDYLLGPPTPLEPHDPYPSLPFTIDSLCTTLTSTAWGQDSPYNMYCPKINGVSTRAGCVAVALAQIAAFHKFPSSYKNLSLDWESITEDSVPIFTYDQITLAHFIADVGCSVHTNYGINVSTATNLQAKYCLDSLGYSHSLLDTINFNTCYEDFLNGRPEYIKGQRVVEHYVNRELVTDTVGHAWVIDGAMVRSMHLPVKSGFVRVNIQRLLHCNWGNDGNYNGYFNIKALQPIPSDTTRKPYINVGIIHNICPNR